MPNGPYKSSPGDQARTADDKPIAGPTSATATAGGGQAALATVAGYVIIQVNGVDKKVPYFNV
ncbi:MAG TPA: hypothetical protein VIY48_03030 [Candidatus Paceibacterota bacterium]